MQDYPTIRDLAGEQIHPGSVVKPYRDIEGHIEEPGGIVTKLTEMDVDSDEDGTHRYGPFVYVKHDDGDELRYEVTDAHRSTWADYMMDTEYEWVCEDIEIEPQAEVAEQNCGEADKAAAESAFYIRHADWLERQGRHDEAAEIRRDYPF